MAIAWATWANAAGYQAVWLASVGGASQGLTWPALATALAFAVATLAWGGRRRDDLRLAALAVPLGLGFDSALAWSGWLLYAEPWPSPRLAPLWIGALWLGFALTLNHSLAFLRQRPALAAGFGLVGGPLAYWAAASAFDAVGFGAPLLAVVGALAAGWALGMPLLLALDGRLAARLAPPRPA